MVLPERSIPSSVTKRPGIRRERSVGSGPMKALVTGGAGFIGSNLVDALVERGDEVTVVDDLSTGKRENLADGPGAAAELVEADIRDARAMRDLVDRVRPQVVFHLAAQIDVRKSTADPAWDAGINVLGTINMLQAALEAGVDRFINTSTGGAIYGEGRILPGARGPPAGARGALRAVEVLRRGLLRPLLAPARPLDRLAPLRQRLRPAPGPARRGRRDRDLLRQAAGGRAADDLRQRRADARLRLRRRRRAGEPRRRRVARQRRVQHRARACRRRSSTSSRRCARSPTATASSPSSRRRGWARCSTSRSTPRARSGELGWEPHITLRDGLERTLASLR